MTDADRILLEVEAELAEEKARRIRERLGGEASAPPPARKPRARRPTQPRVRPDELRGVTSLVDAKVTQHARSKGMVER